MLVPFVRSIVSTDARNSLTCTSTKYSLYRSLLYVIHNMHTIVWNILLPHTLCAYSMVHSQYSHKPITRSEIRVHPTLSCPFVTQVVDEQFEHTRYLYHDGTRTSAWQVIIALRDNWQLASWLPCFNQTMCSRFKIQGSSIGWTIDSLCQHWWNPKLLSPKRFEWITIPNTDTTSGRSKLCY